MKYLKMLGFYLCEFTGCCVNLLSSFFGVYPALDLGVRYLIIIESKKVFTQTKVRQQERTDKEQEAKQLENKARKEDGENLQR